MKISTDSWHYRMLDRLDFEVPDNLCAYCRKVVIALIFVLAIVCMCALAAFMASSIVLHWFIPELRAGAIASGILLIGILTIILTAMIKERKYREWIARRASGEPDPPKRQPNIFVEWARAVHQKVCPILEFDQ